MRVTGERVSSSDGGFNPTFQRHVAAYRLCAPLLPAGGRVLDLGCGVGHSFKELAPRDTVGVDLDPGCLDGQPRTTVVADMRDLPFADASFSSVLSVHSIEHVPNARRVVGEARRVLAPGGVALFVTPNRLTFGRPDEIIDPYHFVEYDPSELHTICASMFASVKICGIFGSPTYEALWADEHRRLDGLLRLDPLRLRRRLPRKLLTFAYDAALRGTRRRRSDVDAGITPDDFSLRSDSLDRAMDLVAVCRTSAD